MSCTVRIHVLYMYSTCMYLKKRDSISEVLMSIITSGRNGEYVNLCTSDAGSKLMALS